VTLRILTLVPYALGTAPSQRYRLEQWAPLLAAAGVDLHFVPFADAELSALLQRPGHLARKIRLMIQAFRRRLRLSLALPPIDAVVIHRAACLAGPAILERWLRDRGLPIVYDFDDAIFLLNAAAANRHFAWLKAPGKTNTLCRIADHVVVCNTYLASYARDRNARVSIIPSSIDTDEYKPGPFHVHEPVVVGWIGSSTSQTHLEAASPMLQALLARRAVELRIVSDRRPNLPGVPHSWREWSAAREVDELAQFDIGIMPLPDDDWARGKCGFKALQYMAMGVGTVAAAVGTNREIIEHGQNGLLARGSAEWIACVEALVDNPMLRRSLGAAGRRTIEARFSMRSSAPAFAKIVQGVVESRMAARVH
jgi:glycosyltransferase involved in cell wall biosynthesis